MAPLAYPWECTVTPQPGARAEPRRPSLTWGLRQGPGSTRSLLVTSPGQPLKDSGGGVRHGPTSPPQGSRASWLSQGSPSVPPEQHGATPLWSGGPPSTCAPDPAPAWLPLAGESLMELHYPLSPQSAQRLPSRLPLCCARPSLPGLQGIGQQTLRKRHLLLLLRPPDTPKGPCGAGAALTTCRGPWGSGRRPGS